VDVEALDRRVAALRLAERFFGAAEVAALARAPEAEQGQRFLALWTLKESLGKAKGRGVAPVLRHPQFAVGADGRVEATSGAGWRHELHALASGHWLAISARDATRIHCSEPKAPAAPGPG
jgi:phosphopantetheinyl transferase